MEVVLDADGIRILSRAVVDPSGRVVIIDTNFVGKGHFRADKVAGLSSRLAARGHRVVVPQVVVWEWAQHAHDSLHLLRSALDTARGALDAGFGLDVPKVKAVSVEDLEARLLAFLDTLGDVDVEASDPNDALQAIRQQVMQVGVGSRGPGGTKTGAADALVLSLVERLVDEYDEVVLATADKVLADQVETSVGAKVVRSHRGLWTWHGLTQPPTDDLVRDLEIFVRESIQERLADGVATGLIDSGFWLSVDIYEDTGLTSADARQTEVELLAVDSVELLNVEVVEGNEVPRLLIGDLLARGEASITNWYVGGPDADLIDENAVTSVVIEVPITAEFSVSWRPQGFEPSDQAEVYSRHEW